MKNFDVGKQLNQILGGKKINKITEIQPLVAKAEETYPFVIYKRLGYQPKSDKDYTQEQTSVQIEVCTDNYKEGIEITNQICDILTATKTKDIYSIEITNIYENFLLDTFIQGINILIIYN